MSPSTLIVVCLALVGTAFAVYGDQDRCTAFRIIDDAYKEVFIFNDPHWENIALAAVTNMSNIGPMQGTWSFEVVFCQSVGLYIGDMDVTPANSLLGWNHGDMHKFEALAEATRIPFAPITPPAPGEAATPNPHTHDLAEEFRMHFNKGDNGAPCIGNQTRSSVAHIWCAYDASSCRGVPGARAGDEPQPYSGLLNNGGFALCGIVVNETEGLCHGVHLHLLSNSCPKGQVQPRYVSGSTNVPQMTNSALGLLALIVVLGFVVFFVAVFAYNMLVRGRRGVTALPFYDGCCGPVDELHTPAVSDSDRGAYGAI